MYKITFMYICILFESIQCQSYKHIGPSKKEKLYLQNNTTVDDNSHFEEKHYERKEMCFNRFKQHGEGSTAMLLERNINKFTCKYFKTVSTKTKSTSEDVQYVTKSNKKCSGLCEEFSSLCGTCKCVEACGEVIITRFICDCTKAQGPVPKDTCSDISFGSRRVNGLYEIDPDGDGVMRVQCFMQMIEFVNRDLSCDIKVGVMYERYSRYTTHHTSTPEQCRDICRGEFQNDKTYNFVHWRLHDTFCHCMKDVVTKHHASYYGCFWTLDAPQPFKSAKPMILMLKRLREEDRAVWNKTYEEYKKGFGTLNNVWLGLDNIHRITTTFNTDMKVVIVTSLNDKVTTVYKKFRINDGASNYKYFQTSFDSMNAREGYGKDSFSSGWIFEECENGWWWNCKQGKRFPTSNNTASFGLSDMEIKGIAMFLITHDRR